MLNFTIWGDLQTSRGVYRGVGNTDDEKFFCIIILSQDSIFQGGEGNKRYSKFFINSLPLQDMVEDWRLSVMF